MRARRIIQSERLSDHLFFNVLVHSERHWDSAGRYGQHIRLLEELAWNCCTALDEMASQEAHTEMGNTC